MTDILTPDTLAPRERPTFYFIGVTTGKSSILNIFPRWMDILEEDAGIQKAELVGVDVPLGAPPAAYRKLVQHMKDDPNVVGGLVTTHKLDLVAAARDLFDGFDTYGEMLGEASAISKRRLAQPSPLRPLPQGETLTPAPSPSGRGERFGDDSSYMDAVFRVRASKAMEQIARDLRQRQTRAEFILWEALSDRRLGGLKFRRQHAVGNTAYVADFLCYEAKLVIELDGGIHNSQREADAVRQSNIEAEGYKVIRFTNEQVYSDLENVLVQILQAASPSKRLINEPLEKAQDSAIHPPLPEGEGTGVRVLYGHALDPISSGQSIEAFLPLGQWREGAEVLIFGCGGAAVATTIYLAGRADRPRRVTLTDISESRLAHARAIHQKMQHDIEFEYILNADAAENDRLMAALPRGSLVINATGMGKDRPGSPITDSGMFPQDGYAWEFNYRGELTFLHQAKRQAAARNLHVEDGWTYFVHGWALVVAAVFEADLTPPLFAKLDKAART
jgi:very-short-patch-repair endonuclease/shikimate 5-dehydrogenase